MTLAEALNFIQDRLANVSDSPRAEAYTLLGHMTELSRTELTLSRQHALSNEQVDILHSWLERRVNREPLQHILGVAPFYGLEFNVTPDVLIPRPETERLVELALEDSANLSAPNILDVGTGSGAVALAIKSERPEARVMATDVSAEALKVARVNAQKLGLEVRFVRADLLADAELEAFARELDMLVSNLPYLPEADREVVSPEVGRDPDLALYSGSDGLEHFKRLERQAFALLSPGALCWLELDPRTIRQAASLAERWAGVKIVNDLAGRERLLRLKR